MMALPWLELNVLAKKTSPPALRFASFYSPMGFVRDHFFPGEGDPELECAHVGWINEMYRKIYAASGGIPAGPGTEGCYFNYPDTCIGSTEADTPPVEQALELYFGENLPRLVRVCAEYNPDGWFQNSQTISNIL